MPKYNCKECGSRSELGSFYNFEAGSRRNKNLIYSTKPITFPLDGIANEPSVLLP